jgi:hypothetical protein
VSEHTLLDGALLDAAMARRLVDSRFPQWSHLLHRGTSASHTRATGGGR